MGNGGKRCRCLGVCLYCVVSRDDVCIVRLGRVEVEGSGDGCWYFSGRDWGGSTAGLARDAGGSSMSSGELGPRDESVSVWRLVGPVEFDFESLVLPNSEYSV